MTDLEFIELQIATTKSKYKEHTKYNQTSFATKDEKKLKILQQIKNKLEAWEVVKKYVKEISVNGIAFEHIINVSHTEQNYELVKKALEVKDE